MYIPPFNEEKRLPVMQELMRAQPLATLVSLTSSGLFATHLPLVLHAGEGEYGTLRGHISRANLQGRATVAEVDVLAIFAGAQHYVSPNWYPTKQVHGMVVPTWNYVVVHAYGAIAFLDDPAWLLTHLETLTSLHEAASPKPWKVTDAPVDYIAGQAKGIVGMEIPIRRIEGKWKVSQNRNQADRLGVVEGLGDVDTAESRAMAELIPRE